MATLLESSSRTADYEDARSRATAFLDTVYALDAIDRSRAAVDVIIDHIDDLLIGADFEECDVTLGTATPDKMSASSIVSILGITFAAKTRLAQRRNFFQRAVAHLTDKRGATAAMSLLHKYE